MVGNSAVLKIDNARVPDDAKPRILNQTINAEGLLDRPRFGEQLDLEYRKSSRGSLGMGYYL